MPQPRSRLSGYPPAFQLSVLQILATPAEQFLRKSQTVRVAVAERDGWRCGLCSGEIASPRDLSIDHVIPLAFGGGNDFTNVQAAHRSCNSQKRHVWPKGRR